MQLKTSNLGLLHLACSIFQLYSLCSVSWFSALAFLLSWHSTGCSFPPLFRDSHVQLGPSSDVLSLMYATIWPLSLLGLVARESKIFSARWSFPLIPYHKACLSQMKWTQNTESKKQGKNVLGQQIINSHTMKCSHNATT